MIKKLFGIVFIYTILLGAGHVAGAGKNRLELPTGDVAPDERCFASLNKPLASLVHHYKNIKFAFFRLEKSNACGVYRQLFTQLVLTIHIFLALKDLDPQEFLWNYQGEKGFVHPLTQLIMRLGSLAAYVAANHFVVKAGQSIDWVLLTALDINSALSHVGMLRLVDDDEKIECEDECIRKSERERLKKAIDAYPQCAELDVARDCQLILNLNLRLLNKLLTMFSSYPINILNNKVIKKISEYHCAYASVINRFVIPNVAMIKNVMQSTEDGHMLDCAIASLGDEFVSFSSDCRERSIIPTMVYFALTDDIRVTLEQKAKEAAQPLVYPENSK